MAPMFITGSRKTARNLAARIILISGDTANSETQSLLSSKRHAVHRKTVSCSAIDLLPWRKLSGNHERRPQNSLLVVDDEQSIRRLCMTIGTSLGFFATKPRARKPPSPAWKPNPPDLVLTDLKLPNQSGVELLKQIKAHCRAPKWPS